MSKLSDLTFSVWILRQIVIFIKVVEDSYIELGLNRWLLWSLMSLSPNGKVTLGPGCPGAVTAGERAAQGTAPRGGGGGTLGSSLRSPAEGEGHEGFPPPPDKDLESPSSTRL